MCPEEGEKQGGKKRREKESPDLVTTPATKVDRRVC